MPDQVNKKTCALGRNGPQIPALGFGLMGLSCNLPPPTLILEDAERADISTQHFTEFPRLMKNDSSFLIASMSSGVRIGTLRRSTETAKNCLGSGFNEQASGKR